MRSNQMIPFASRHMTIMAARAMGIMLEHGLFERSHNDAENADRMVDVMRAHGCMDHTGENVIIGRCVLLRHTEYGFALLPVTPCPADEYDSNLRRKPSPVLFARTARGEIVVPGRWLVAKLEALAGNPSASDEVRALANRIAQRSRLQLSAILLPSDVATFALTTRECDGGTRVVEALPGGCVLSFDPDTSVSECTSWSQRPHQPPLRPGS